MSEFKLIGIRPIKNCDRKFCKVLTIGKPYIFYHQYDFSSYSDRNRKVLIQNDGVPDIYSITNSEKKKILINISALAGENGSGKAAWWNCFM